MDEKLIEVREVWNLFKKRWWIIIIITTITTSLAINKVKDLKPSYMATSKVFIAREGELLQLYSMEELEYYSEFVNVFSEISKIDGFFDKALKEGNIQMSSISVASRLSFTAVGTSIPLYTIQYSGMTEAGMAETLDIVSKELVKQIKEIMPDTKPTILNEAMVYPMYPDKKRLPMMAFGIGIVLSIGVILVADYFDDRIKNKKRLEKILEIPILVEIPREEKIKKDKKNKLDKG